MYKIKFYQLLLPMFLLTALIGCKAPALVEITPSTSIPGYFGESKDTINSSVISWRTFFKDPYLVELIDTAIKNNQELKITLQEIEMAKNDIMARKGALLPMVELGAGTGVEKVGRYTSQGAGDASTEITPGVEVPDVLPDMRIAANARWEIDIWKKLRNAKQAAVNRFLSSVEGKNFVITNLVAEVAGSYYELLALDSQLEIIRKNIDLQKKSLDIVKIQKESARATELAVQKFQAEVLSSQSMEFDILQKIKETENRINFLLARYPQEIKRDKREFTELLPEMVKTGIPSQLLTNRPDIKQAEYELAAAKLDVKVARAEFFPSLNISAAFGLQAFKPSYLYTLPESMLFSVAGDLAGPLINKNAIKAEFYNASARQLQSMYQYERTILNAYIEVFNQLSRINNLGKTYDFRLQQVNALNRSIEIANDLYISAKADYLEVLTTQRDALESKLELIEIKKDQMVAGVNIYKQLGGGWR